MAEFSAPKLVGVSTPRTNDGDLPGFKPKVYLTEKSPYVKDKTGMIWPREKWMEDMGDVLEPTWEAPPKPGIIVQVAAPLDTSAYPQPETKKARVRKGWPKGKPRGPRVSPPVQHEEGGASDDGQRGAAPDRG